MKHVIKSSKVLMVTISVLSAILTLCGAAQAAWYINSGNCGSITDESVLGEPTVYHGIGLEFSLMSDTAT